MKFSYEPLKKYTIKIIWLLSILFILWIGYQQFRVYNEAVLNPPAIEQNQVSARQLKVNEKIIDQVQDFHEQKTQSSESKVLKRDPFSTVDLDSPFE